MTARATSAARRAPRRTPAGRETNLRALQHSRPQKTGNRSGECGNVVIWSRPSEGPKGRRHASPGRREAQPWVNEVARNRRPERATLISFCRAALSGLRNIGAVQTQGFAALRPGLCYRRPLGPPDEAYWKQSGRAANLRALQHICRTPKHIRLWRRADVVFALRVKPSCRRAR